MSVTNTDPENLRRYLLGQQPEEEERRMEERLLQEDELSELAESVEEELLIEHFQGKLPEGRDLVHRLSASAAGRRRVELAQAVAQAIPGEPAVAPPEPSPAAEVIPIRRPFFDRPTVRTAMAIAAALVGVVVGIRVLTPLPSSAPKQAQVASTRGVEPPPAQITLPLSGTRSGEESLKVLDLRPEQTRAELKLPLKGETCPSCQVSLTREDGSQVPHHWKVDQGSLVILVRAADLPAGVYGVKVQGVREGEPDLLGDVQLQVSRSKSK
jgi:hypothetical protein